MEWAVEQMNGFKVHKNSDPIKISVYFLKPQNCNVLYHNYRKHVSIIEHFSELSIQLN